jgi:hypothetical protein
MVVISEVIFWCSNNHYMQEFLLRFAGIQTYPNSLRRFREIYTKFQFLFEAGASKTSEYIDIESLMLLIKSDMPEISQEDLDVFQRLLLASTQDSHPDTPEHLVNKEIFIEISKAWAAFSATDINYDNILSKKELKYLLYCYESFKEEDTFPSPQRVEYEWKHIDKDRSKSISRREWLEYLSIDPSK